MSASDILENHWRNLAGIPLDENEPVFEEPWQAQAFALAVSLNERRVFEWPQWAEILGAQIAADPETSYWSHWLAALETILARQDIATPESVDSRTAEWHEAAARTPHGEAIVLQQQRP